MSSPTSTTAAPLRGLRVVDLSKILAGPHVTMSLTGEPDGPPVKAGYAMADLSAALFGTIGVLSALVERSSTPSRARCDKSAFP
ncbi:hypothetical protein GCM10027174_09110 [Salinifilum aidingensis]